jgi:hypothetical protein
MFISKPIATGDCAEICEQSKRANLIVDQSNGNKNNPLTLRPNSRHIPHETRQMLSVGADVGDC